MPVIRELISVSQLAELLGVDPKRLIDVEVHQAKSTAALVLEPEDDMRHVQTTGTCPPLSDNTQRRPKPKKGKR